MTIQNTCKKKADAGSLPLKSKYVAQMATKQKRIRL
jgi:hypothetical protein